MLQNQVEPVMPGAAASGGVDILLVEDNPSYVELTLRALQEIAKDDLRVQIASDGERALEILLDPGAPRRPRLVILDIKLPKVSGIEVLRRLRANAATRFLPAVMITSSRLPKDVRTCYELGANSYVVRPMSFPSYLKVIADIIGYWLVINEAAPDIEPE